MVHIRSAWMLARIAMIGVYAAVAGTALAQDADPGTAAPAPPATSPPTSILSAEDSQAPRSLETAIALLQEQRLDEAVAMLQALAEDQPGDPAVLRLLGVAEVSRQNYPQGIDALRRAAELSPDDTGIRFDLAAGYEGAGETAEAEAVYRALLDVPEARIEATFRLAGVLAATGRGAEAIEGFERVAAAGAEVPARAAEAAARLNLLYAQVAREHVAALERGDPGAFTSAMTFGTGLVGKNRLDEARTIFEAVARIHPDQAPGYYWLSRVQITRGEMEAGLENLERAAARAPDNLRLRIELGRAYEAADRLDRAEQTFTEVLGRAQDPRLIEEASRQLGLLQARRLFAAQDWEAALPVLDEVLARSPDDSRVLEMKAQALDELGRGAEADRLYGALIARSPGNVALLSRVAAVHERRGEQDRARELYGRILQIVSVGESARQALDRLGLGRGAELLRQDRPAEALRVFESILEVAPDNPAANLAAGMAYRSLQRFDEAEAALRKVIASEQAGLAAWIELGQVYEQSGRTEEATSVFEQVARFARTQQEQQLLRERLGAVYQQEIARTSAAFERGAVDTGAVLSLAQRLVQRGFNELAVGLLEPALARAPDDARLHFWLGNAHIGLGQSERGLQLFERAVQLAPGNTDLLMELAAAYTQAGKLEDAELSYVEVARRTRDDAQKRLAERSLGLVRAQMAQDDGDFARALAEYERLLRDDPGDPQLLLGQARMLTLLGRGGDADRIITRLLEIAPDNLGVRLTLAQIYRARGMTDEAVQQYRHLLERNPALVAVQFELASLYESTGRWEDALREYSLLLERTQGTDQAAQVGAAMGPLVQDVNSEGMQLIAQGQLDAAEDHFKRLIRVLPRNPQALYLLSEVYREKGRRDLQVERLEQAVALGPTNIPMRRRLAFAYADAGMQDRAETAMDELLQDFPFDSEVRFRRAELYARRGDEDRAREEYVLMLELNPTREWRVRALDRLGLERARALQEGGQTDQAVAAVQGVLEVAPGDPIANAALARIYQQAGRSAEAEAAWREVLEVDRGDRNARLELARILAGTGREPEAVSLYYALASEGVATSQSEEARSELDRLLLRRAQAEIERLGDMRDAAVLEERLLPVGIEAFDLGAMTAAQPVFEQLVRVAPESAAGHFWLGRVYAEQNNFPDSLVFIRRSNELAPGNPLYLQWLGRVYAEMQIFRSAEQSFEQALALDPDDVEAYLELGELYRRRGEDMLAERQFARALERAPDPPAVERALQALGLPADPDRLTSSQLDQARRVFDELLSGLPRSAAGQYYVASVYHRAQRYAEAESIYRALRERDPGQVLASLKLARLLAETDRIDESIALFGEIIERGGPQLAQQAQQAQTELLVRQAQLQTELLNRREGDVRLARRLGRALLERGQAEPTAALMRAALVQGPEVSEVQYLLGRALVDMGEFEPGLAALERSVALAPPDLALTLRQHLAIAYERAGRTDEAVRIHRALYQQATDPQLRMQARVRLALARGAQLVQAEDYRGALREYDDALAQAPNDVLLLTERGRVLVQLGRGDEADRVFEQVLVLAPQNVPVRMRLIEVYQARGETAKYLPHAAAILRINPFGPEAQAVRSLFGFDRGRELLQAGAAADAAEVFQRVLDVVPTDAVARLALAEAYLQQRRLADADRVVTGVIRDYPELQDAYFLRGNIFQRLDRREDAIAQYEQAVARGAGTETGRQAMAELERLYSLRVQDLIAAGEEETAILELARQLEAAPGNTAARNNLIILYSRRQRYAEALDQLDELIRLQPDNAVAHAQRGSLLAVLQRNFESAEAYGRAVSLDRDEQSANANVRELILSLSRYQVDAGRPFAAIRDLSMLNERGLGDERSYAMLGALYRQQNRYDEAGRALRDAIRLAPDNAIMRFNLADIYEQTSDYDLALLQYRQVLRTSQPGGRVWEEARRRAEMWTNRLALFSSQLQYTTTIGDSNIEEQDLNRTGALNTSFSSQLFYNLGTNFWPTNNLNLRLDTGLVYIANHSTQRDNFFPRAGVAGNLNFQNHFYSASFHVSDIRDLMLDTYEGTSYSANASAGLRFTDSPLELFRNWTRKRRSETGEAVIERSSLEGPRAMVDPMVENPRLRGTLLETYRQRQSDPGLPAVPGVDPGRIFGDGETSSTVPAAPEPLDELDAALALEREEDVRRRVEAVMEEYRAGRTNMLQGRLDAALADFRRVLQAAPNDPLTLVNLAAIYQRQARFAEAERAYLDARAADPGNRELDLRLAAFYEDTGQDSRAIAVIEEMVDAAPGVAEREAALARLRALYRRQADIVLGQPEPSPEDEDLAVLHAAAEGLLEAGDPVSAGRILDTLLERYPEDAEGYQLRARTHLELGATPQAVQDARTSLEYEPGEPRYLLTLARALEAAGDHAQAGTVYRLLAQAPEQDDLTAAARYELGLMQAGQFEAAGETQRALEVYLELLEDRPHDTGVLLRAAAAEARLGRLDEARDRYLRVLELEPEDVSARLQLADLYRRRGEAGPADEQLAQAWARATTEEERGQVRARLGLGEALDAIRRNRPGNAMAALERMQAVLPEDALVQLNIGVVHQMEGRFPEAQAAFQRILDADPANLTARLRLGLLYSETDRIDRAIPVLERVASEGSGMSAGDRAQAGLQGLEERRLRTLVGGDRIGQTVPTIQTLQGRVFYSDTALPRPSIAESFSYGFGLTYSYRSLQRGDWLLSYTFGIRDYEHPLGSDYAYWWYDLGVTYRSPVPNLWRLFGSEENIPGLSGSVTLGYESREYTYVDTYALNVLGQVRRRVHRTNTLSLGLNYQPPGYSQIGFFATYTRGWSRANLPVGITFSPEGIPVAFQSAGLGSFDPNFISLGMSFQF